LETIRKRKSIRAFSESPYNLDEIQHLILDPFEGIFGHSLTVHALDSETAAINHIKRISTYGVITGNPAYVFAKIEPDKNQLIDYGYCFENLVLKLTNMGIATCWVGSILNITTIEKALELDESELIPALIAVGEKNESQRWHQKWIQKKHEIRKNIDQLVYTEFMGKKLSAYQRKHYSILFNALKYAPSANNKQPWRIIIDGLNFHFYIESTQNRTSRLNMNYVDLGIILSHFEKGVEAMDISGEWMEIETKPMGRYEYIISFKMDK